MSYESIVITKYADGIWFAKDNTLSLDVPGYFVSGWSGSANNDLISLKSANGGIVYNNQPWSIYSYEDENDTGNNFTPISPVDLVTKLNERGFFDTSSGGGGGSTTFLGLTDVLFANYFGRENQVIIVNGAGTGLTSVTPSFAFQNNIATLRRKYFIGHEGVVTATMLADFYNSVLSPISISETHAPVVIEGVSGSSSSDTIYAYFFKPGKGVYGTAAGGETIQAQDFQLFSIRNLIPEDIAGNPNTVIFNLGTISDGDYVAYANTQGPFNWGDSGEPDNEGNPKTYFFTYITDGVTYFAQFVGTPGVYGVGETPFVEADFVDTTNSDITPTQNLQQTTDIGNTTTNPIVVLGGGYQIMIGNQTIEYTQGGNLLRIKLPDTLGASEVTFDIPTRATNDTFAMLSDLAGGSGITRSFLYTAVGDTDTFIIPELVGANEIQMISSNVSGNTMKSDFAFNSSTGEVNGYPVLTGEEHLIFYN
jgi:hypothetical protein